MEFLCYPKCSTCKKAEKWLIEQGIAYHKRDIKEENPSKDEIAAFHKKSGLPLKKFFNTSGRLYREQHLKDTLPGMTEEEMYALLGSDGMLVKRPILVCEDCVLTGFNEKVWEEKLINGK